ncbi:hypothetical protein [Paenibacillus sp. FJAT-26967]|uniref:hypothetical protein n=1 Tax=Paenibacillus sp. FJAT-26967 TaxID=1729690 RepID=UPI000837F34B|nr:hypothetical protein [Paenibacillus sp. FJAT-26967]
MDMKAIDLQFAIHKNDEAGIRQQMLNHKPEMDQALLGAEAEKKAERSRRSSERISDTDEVHVRKEGHQNNGSGHNGNKSAKERQAEEAKPVKAVHPYKGSHIDYSL